MEEATLQTIRYLRIHGSGIDIEPLRQPIIRDQRDRIERAAAGGGTVVRAARHGMEARLVLVIIAAADVEVRGRRPFEAGPVDVELPVLVEGRVVDDAQDIAAEARAAVCQRILRI